MSLQKEFHWILSLVSSATLDGGDVLLWPSGGKVVEWREDEVGCWFFVVVIVYRIIILLRFEKKCCNNPSGHPVLRPTRHLDRQQMTKVTKKYYYFLSFQVLESVSGSMSMKNESIFQNFWIKVCVSALRWTHMLYGIIGNILLK